MSWEKEGTVKVTGTTTGEVRSGSSPTVFSFNSDKITSWVNREQKKSFMSGLVD